MVDMDRLNPSIRWLSLLFLSLGLCMTAEVHAQQPDDVEELKEKLDNPPDKWEMRRMQSKQSGFSKARQPQPARSFLEVNNATVTIDRDGRFAFADPFTSNNGSYPRATSGHTTFAHGFMFGGKVKDGLDTQIRTGGATYFTGMKPGGVDPQTGEPEDQTNTERFHVWRVHRDWEDPTVQRQSAAYAAGVSDPNEVSEGEVMAVRDQYDYDWNNWPAADGAPYQDCNGDGSYQPADPEDVDSGTSCDNLESGDIPGRRGADQTIWTVANDMGSESLGDDFSAVYGSPEIGVEVQYTLWAYDRPPGSALGNIDFFNTKLIYTGKPEAHPNPTPPDAEIDSMFISWWVDPDVGTFSNDFVGVDPSEDLGYAYNAGPSDAVYQDLGLPPPAMGIDFLEGPVNAEGDTLGLSSFTFFAAGTAATDPALFDYTGTLEWFNLMRGVRPQPAYPAEQPFINPITNEPAIYANNGDPVTRQGWIDGEFVGPSDRRMVNTTGPFSMAVGDTVSVTVAQVKAVRADYLSSISLLRFYDRAAQFAFDQDFQLPSPPPAPGASAKGLDEKVVLNWGDVENDATIRSTEEAYSAPPGFEFQGYRVYQLPRRNAALDEGERVATFDVEDGVSRLRDNVFDEDTRAVEQRIVQTLNETGIERDVVFERDRLQQRPLANGNDYYYAVTSFGYLEEDVEGIPSRVLESSPVRFRVRPQSPAPGTENVPEVGMQIPANQEGDNETSTTVEVVDPFEVEDADYTVTFGSSWNLLKNGNEVVSDVPVGDSRIVDGVKVEVTGDESTVDPGDQWTFSTQGEAPQEADEQQLREEVGNIGVFPNPYRGFNNLEDSRFDKFVRFRNLPSPDEGTTTIRIFTLSGNPVRVIRHDSESPNENFRDWDLRNENDTFVSSGVYLAYVNTPFGEKTLRLALAMEEEVLRNY